MTGLLHVDRTVVNVALVGLAKNGVERFRIAKTNGAHGEHHEDGVFHFLDRRSIL